MNAPEVAPPGVARKAQGVELAPLAIQLHLHVTLDADEVTDAPRIKPGEQVSIGKAAIGCQAYPMWRDILKDQREGALDHGQFIACHPAFEHRLVIGTPKNWQGAAAHHQRDDK